MARVRRLKWAIVGVGVAGLARAKAIASDPRAGLVAVWRGRNAGEAGAPVAGSLEEAIAAADAVAICSPSDLHAEHVRAVLDAGRHALCEFPLAMDPGEAAALMAHAARIGKVLHTEHIELLDPTCGTLMAHVRPSTVRSVSVAFDRPGAQDAGPLDLALGNVARLHRVAAFAGPFAAIERVRHEPGLLDAELRLASGAVVQATFRQGQYYARRTTIDVETVAGRWSQQDDHLSRDGMPVTLVGLGSLFGRDQIAASARILDGAPPYVGDDRILHVLEVAHRLGRLEAGGVTAGS